MKVLRHVSQSLHRRLSTASIAAFLAIGAPVFADTFTVDLGDQLTLGGDVSTGNIIKQGLGTLFLTPGKTYSVGTTIAAGSLVITNGRALGSGPVNVLGSVTRGADSSQLVLAGGVAPTALVLPPLSIAGGGPAGPFGGALLSVGNNQISGAITVSSTIGTGIGSTFGTASLAGFTIGTGQTTSLRGTGNFSMSGLSGTGTLQKVDAGTLAACRTSRPTSE